MGKSLILLAQKIAKLLIIIMYIDRDMGILKTGSSDPQFIPFNMSELESHRRNVIDDLNQTRDQFNTIMQEMIFSKGERFEYQLPSIFNSPPDISIWVVGLAILKQYIANETNQQYEIFIPYGKTYNMLYQILFRLDQNDLSAVMRKPFMNETLYGHSHAAHLLPNDKVMLRKFGSTSAGDRVIIFDNVMEFNKWNHQRIASERRPDERWSDVNRRMKGK